MRRAVKGGEVAGTLTPREVFRMCEAENLREYRVDREPLFMRFDGERDRVRLGNPALLALASQAGDVAGSYDGDFVGAASALGERTFNALGGVEGLKQLGARALGVLRGDAAAPPQATPASKTGEAGDPDTGDVLADEAALVALRTNPRLRGVLLEGGSVNGVTLRGLLHRRRIHGGWRDVLRFPVVRNVMEGRGLECGTESGGAAAALRTLLAQVDTR
jgi:hypothetical protein